MLIQNMYRMGTDHKGAE